MPFKSILKRLVENVDGAQGAILLDWEGEAVDQYAVISDYDIKFLGAHMGIILYSLTRRLKEELGDDDVKSVIIDFGNKRFAVCTVDKDYFAVLVLSPDVVLGLVRRELEMAVNAIRKEF